MTKSVKAAPRAVLSVRVFALHSGWCCMALFVLSWIPALTSPQGRTGLLLGFVPTSPLLAALYLVLGVCGILSSTGYRASVHFARGAAVVLGSLALLAILPVTAAYPLLAPLTLDVLWVHGLAAMLSVYTGWGEPSRAFISML